MGTQAKFPRYGRLYYFFQFLIVHTIFVPNSMFLTQIFTILLRKTKNRRKALELKLSMGPQLNFQNMANYFIFLISHCTNYIRAKFHVPMTIFYHFIKKNLKPQKRPSGLKITLGPRAKFSKYGQLFQFFLFPIIQTTFMPNFMFLGPFITILLRKTKNRKKALRLKILNGPSG